MDIRMCDHLDNNRAPLRRKRRIGIGGQDVISLPHHGRAMFPDRLAANRRLPSQLPRKLQSDATLLWTVGKISRRTCYFLRLSPQNRMGKSKSHLAKITLDRLAERRSVIAEG